MRLYWSKGEDKNASDKKSLDLCEEVAAIAIGAKGKGLDIKKREKRGEHCSNSNKMLNIQFVERENREEKIQDWLKVVRSFSAGGYECAVDRDGDGDSNTNDKSRGKGKNTRSYIMVGPGNSREYQHPVRIEADKNRCACVLVPTVGRGERIGHTHIYFCFPFDSFISQYLSIIFLFHL